MNTITLIGNILWILGLAIIVSTLGWQIWQTRLPDRKSGGVSSKYGLYAGIFFFCLGIFLSTYQPWALLFLLIATSTIVITLLDLNSTAKELR